ncbi:M23 family metallopeptidase [Pedobacter sp. GR22-6]|uniref:M23 family metallopeptidase n=1 Tax=Pedobacter sp. GR22-6 TaxID=3127957 RepID=UPI00307D7F74
MKFLLCLLLCSFNLANPTIETDRERWKPYYVSTSPASVAADWYLPFDLTRRKDMKQIKIISVFGDHRDSYFRGHIHTAIDLNPRSTTDKLVKVYAMAKGVVCSIHLGENQRTVVLKHKLPDGTLMYTSYKHLKEVYVSHGQQVDQSTKLARLFTVQESKKYGGDYHHLHLEIRKSFDDYGCASWLTMNKTQLNLRFYDPISFLKQKL